MKKFIGFALCAVATIVLIHLILRFFNLDTDNSTAANIVPIAFLYITFYGIPYTKPKGKE
jgi:hypothetical protein|tara:strand:+ start:281 stop:460 length:180 start_codon:yes stop_codon:yes gene_type:complete